MNHKEALQKIVKVLTHSGNVYNTIKKVERLATEALQPESESEWISVEDSRKPENGERILIHCKELNGIQVTGYVFNDIWALPNFVRKCTPTHWMPLPQAPKTPKI